MKHAWTKRLAAGGMLLLLAGCWTRTRTHDPEDPIHYTEKFDYTDLKTATEKMISSIATLPAVTKAPEPPVAIVYGVVNDTDEHVNTKMITDKVRTGLVQSGKLRFINEDVRRKIDEEISYQQSGKTDPRMRIEKGLQAGAQYMLTGTLSSMEMKEGKGIRFTKNKLKYYKLNMELTDLKTSLIVWSDEKEIAREVSEPLIGW